MPQDPSLAMLAQDDTIALLREIAAEPRPTGSDAIAAARERCARELRDMGYEVRQQAFEFSEFPGRFATPLFGGAAAMIVGVAGQWGRGTGGGDVGPALLLILAAVVLFAAGRWLAVRGVLAAPVMRRRGVNLEATRPGAGQTIWLCAHLDSKSQPVPTLARSVGIVLESAGYLLALALTIVAAVGATPHRFYWEFAAVVTLVGAMPVVLSVVGRRSPGALDNASGVATVIAAARQLADRPAVGILLTDGEELGLAGARAWARGRSGATVLNCDGVDDSGGIQVMFTGKRPRRLLDAIARASPATGVAYDTSRLIPGVLTDSVAFTDAALESVTFSRGSWRSLGRVHSQRDDLQHLNGNGIAETVKLIAGTVGKIGETQ